MKQRHTAPSCPARDGTWSLSIDSEGEFQLVFGTIDCRIGSRIDDEVRGQLVEPTGAPELLDLSRAWGSILISTGDHLAHDPRSGGLHPPKVAEASRI
jgi:hypothetical protein